MRQRTGLMAAGGGVLAATLLIAGLDNNAAGQPLAGTCVTSDLAPIPCAEHEAVYQVLTTVQSGKSGCPSGDYFEEGSLCLGYNVAAGDCIQDDPAGPIRVPCGSEVQTPTIRMLKVVEGRASSKSCRSLGGGAVLALTYSVPAKTLCLVHQPLATVG